MQEQRLPCCKIVCTLAGECAISGDARYACSTICHLMFCNLTHWDLQLRNAASALRDPFRRTAASRPIQCVVCRQAPEKRRLRADIALDDDTYRGRRAKRSEIFADPLLRAAGATIEATDHSGSVESGSGGSGSEGESDDNGSDSDPADGAAKGVGSKRARASAARMASESDAERPEAFDHDSSGAEGRSESNDSGSSGDQGDDEPRYTSHDGSDSEGDSESRGSLDRHADARSKDEAAGVCWTSVLVIVALPDCFVQIRGASCLYRPWRGILRFHAGFQCVCMPLATRNVLLLCPGSH